MITLEFKKGILAVEDDPGEFLLIFYEDDVGKTQSIDIPLEALEGWDEE